MNASYEFHWHVTSVSQFDYQYADEYTKVLGNCKSALNFLETLIVNC